LTFGGTPTLGSTFKLTFGRAGTSPAPNLTTANILWDPVDAILAGRIQTALSPLFAPTGVVLVVPGSTPGTFDITFGGALSNGNMPLLAVAPANNEVQRLEFSNL